MAFLRQWLLGVVSCAFLVSLLDQLTPEGSVRKLARFSGGLVLILCMLRPLGTAEPRELALDLDGLSADRAALEEQYRDVSGQSLAAVIAERTGAYIEDKAHALGTEVTAEVTVREEDGAACMAVDCLTMDVDEISAVLTALLYEFPVRELDFALPRWVTMLDKGHWLQTEVYTAAMQLSGQIARMKDISDSGRAVLDCEAVENAALSGMDLADGIVRITVLLKPEVFYRVLSEQTGLEIGDEAGLMPCIIELAKAKRAYEKIRSAMEQVEATGYGIVMPSIDELSLEQPEIVRQGGRYGVSLEASAPSIHMMKAIIHTELSPIVGTEKQSEDLVQSLLQDFEDDPVRLWESNIFGKSLHELVNDGLQNKLLHMPQEARGRLQETLERVINEGCTGLICILL